MVGILKITFFISSLYGGGAERVTCNLASYLVQHGHDVEILTMSETKEKYELDSKVRTQTLLPLNNRKSKIWNTLIRFPRLWRYLYNTKNDAYVVMLPKVTIMLMMFKWMTKAKVIASERVAPSAYSNTKKRFLKHYAPKMDGIVFQTEDAKVWYGDSVRKVKTTIIPNAINPSFIRPQYQGVRNKVISGAGRLTDQKNFSLLIKAFSLIANDFPEYNLIIYGEGGKRQALEELIEKLGLTHRVSLPGNINNIAETMEKHSLFVLSSDFEGMPNALMEAMALGVPCISTDCPCGGPRFLIQNGKNGFLVPVGDVEAMANTIKTVLLNPIEAKRIGEMGSTIKERLNPDTIYSTWEKFINDVIIGN